MSVDDRQALCDLVATYAACIDERDWTRYRECFEPDVELVGFGPEAVRGVEAWLQFVETALARFRATQHMLGPQLAEIDGDTARLRTDLQAMHAFTEPQGSIFTLWGTYHSVAVRRDGRWRLRRHQLEVRATQTS
jgi:uncharacterized protein (TIGR02246 family)